MYLISSQDYKASEIETNWLITSFNEKVQVTGVKTEPKKKKKRKKEAITN